MVLQSSSSEKGKSSWIRDLGASFHVTSESLNIKQHQQAKEENDSENNGEFVDDYTLESGGGGVNLYTH